MKLNDSITKSVAASVSDVVEGKKNYKKEEVKYPHMMYSKDGKDEVEVKDKAEHDKYAKMGYGHSKPEKVDEVEEPNKPSGKLGQDSGERDFKGKHKAKKSGEKEDGTVVKEMTITLDEAKLKAGRGKANVDIDHTGEGIPAAAKKYKLKFKKHRNGFDVSGEKKNILAYLQSKEYDMDSDDIEELFPELMEGNMAYENALVKKAVKIASSMGGAMTPAVKKIEKLKKGLSDHPDVKAALKAANEEKEDDKEEEKPVKVESDKEKYQRFFQAALKKFGVKSPAELDGAKKKEFFDYVDKNYAADNETD